MRSPIIELNRAVAIGMAEGPAAALAIVDGLAGEPALKNYHLLQSVRGDLLCKLGRFTEARAAFEAAAALAGNKREQQLLLRRAAEAGVARLRDDFTFGADRFRGRWALWPEAASRSCSLAALLVTKTKAAMKAMVISSTMVGAGALSMKKER